VVLAGCAAPPAAVPTPRPDSELHIGAAVAADAPWASLLRVPSEPPPPPWEPGELWPDGVGWTDATAAAGIFYLPPFPDDPPGSDVLGLCGGGAALLDLDGDGHADLLQVSRFAPPVLWLGGGDGTFEPSPVQPFETEWPVGLVAADLDGDGLREVLILDGTAVRSWRNLGGGDFVEQEPVLETDDNGRPTSAVAADVNGDDLVDLLVVSYGGEATVGASPSADRLLLGRGDGTFVDATDQLPESRSGMGFAATVVDYDRDGRLDLYVVNDKGGWGGPNRLYRATDDGYEDAAPEFGLDLAINGMGVAAGDLNGDGVPEFVLSDTSHSLHLLESSEFGAIDAALGLGLEVAGDTNRSSSWGPLLHDVDHDGDLDVLLAFGALFVGQATFPQRLGLWLAEDGALVAAHDRLPDVTAEQWRTLLPADLDGDGDLDLVVTRSDGSVLVARAEPTGRAWLQVQLVGPPGNLDGLGAEVEVESAVGVQRRRITAGGVGVHAVFEPIAHFGLGEDPAVSRVLVRWPDGAVTESRDVAGNRRVVMTR